MSSHDSESKAKGRHDGDRGDHSSTPPRTRDESRGRSRSRRGGKEIVIRERTVQERIIPGGSIAWPTLTATNYMEWALVMQVNMEANLMWDAIEGRPASVRDDKAAHAALLRAVPPEMVGTLVVKKTAKEAWDTIRTMRLGVDRVKKATVQRLRKQFAQIQFKDGEALEAFGMRINTLANELRILGDEIDEVTVVEKFLQVVPSKYSQIAIAIETLLDTSDLTVEELIGRLRVAEDRYGSDSGNGNGQLLLTEEQWNARKRDSSQGTSGYRDKKKDRPPATTTAAHGTATAATLVAATTRAVAMRVTAVRVT